MFCWWNCTIKLLSYSYEVVFYSEKFEKKKKGNDCLLSEKYYICKLRSEYILTFLFRKFWQWRHSYFSWVIIHLSDRLLHFSKRILKSFLGIAITCLVAFSLIMATFRNNISMNNLFFEKDKNGKPYLNKGPDRLQWCKIVQKCLRFR